MRAARLKQFEFLLYMILMVRCSIECVIFIIFDATSVLHSLVLSCLVCLFLVIFSTECV